MLDLRTPGLEFRILCLEDSVISIISPSSGGSPGPVYPICAQRWPNARFISFTVSLDRVEPAHMECEPTTGTTTQRKTPSNSRKSTATRISSRNPQGPPRPGSADTPTSNGTRVNTKKSTAVRSNQKSATVPKQIEVQVNLSNRDNAYVALH